jgi:GT2 family glycosyltransferase
MAQLERRVNYASGASMLVSRRFLERVGPMREEYFLYAEEVEWCLRGVALGMKIGVAVDAQVMHFQGASTGSVTDVSRRARMPVYLDERNKMLLTRDLFPRRLPVAALAAFLLLFLRFARRRAWRQLGYGLQGWFAGLRNERGKPVWVAD